MTGDRPPRRGEVWQIDFDPIRGHEQGGERPAVIVSIDGVNLGPSELAIVVPFSSRERGLSFHVPIPGGSGGLPRRPSRCARWCASFHGSGCASIAGAFPMIPSR